VRLRKLFKYRLAKNLRRITTAYAIKPVLNAIVVKKGGKNIQKAIL